MANINQFIPFILKWEGGYVNDPDDLGGPTNKGVTLKTWQDCGYDKNGDGIIDEEDLKQIFLQDVVECVLRPHYWNRWQADRIKNQSIANLLVDWMWASGVAGIKIPQQMLKLKPDGIVGEKTLAAINSYPVQKELFDRLKDERLACIERICVARPANQRFRKGWLNRINDIKFAGLILAFFFLSFMGGCKSAVSTKSARIETETTLNSESESEKRMKKQRNLIFSSQEKSELNSETVTETVTVSFDTSLIDSITGRHPVKEMMKTVVTQGKVVLSSNLKKGEALSADSIIVNAVEKTGLHETGNLGFRQQTLTASNRYRWLYLFIIPILFFVGFGWFVKRKIVDFFMKK